MIYIYIYRDIKNAGSRKRAQGRAQDIPYHHTIYTNIMYCMYLIIICIISFLFALHVGHFRDRLKHLSSRSVLLVH